MITCSVPAFDLRPFLFLIRCFTRLWGLCCCMLVLYTNGHHGEITYFLVSLLQMLLRSLLPLSRRIFLVILVCKSEVIIYDLAIENAFHLKFLMGCTLWLRLFLHGFSCLLFVFTDFVFKFILLSVSQCILLCFRFRFCIC